MYPQALHAMTAIHATRYALQLVNSTIRDEAIHRTPIGPPTRTPVPRRGPRSQARLTALIHNERADRIHNERVGIHQIGATAAPVRADLLDLAHTGLARLASTLEDCAWITASSLRRRPLLVYGHAWTVGAPLIGEHPAVAYLRVALPVAPLPVAHEVLGLLSAMADDAWSTLRLAPPHTRHPDEPPCPGCGQHMLRIHQAGPRTAWTVTCGARCVCAGGGCPCGMTELVAGIHHIWAATDLAAAGRRPAAPTQSGESLTVVDGCQHGTAVEIAHRLTAAGRRVTPDAVRGWARRGSVVRCTPPGRGGDVWYRVTRYHLAGQGRGNTWYRLDKVESGAESA